MQFDRDQVLLGARSTIFIFLIVEPNDEKAAVDSKRCSDVRKACNQKDASGKNRPNVEENRGSDAAKSL
jgi:hypothetical protein